jgi:hypothetical protein
MDAFGMAALDAIRSLKQTLRIGKKKLLEIGKGLER